MFPATQLWICKLVLMVGSVVTAEMADSGPITVVPCKRYICPVAAPAGAMYSPARILESLLYLSTRRTTAQRSSPLIGVMINLDSSVFWRNWLLCHAVGFV